MDKVMTCKCGNQKFIIYPHEIRCPACKRFYECYISANCALYF